MAGGTRHEISHAYFCLSDAEIARSHSWNRAAYPATASTSAYYYRQRGLYFETFEAYWRAAMAAYRKGEKRFVGYLASYGSDSTFRRNLQRAATVNTPRSLGWTGPKGKAGEVIMTFGS